jgi:AraC family transcriptional regulator of adaptative response / DNA-3-methyladenine glycosylase II
LAQAAAQRIAAGALNGHNVAELAAELGVSARHLRRALEREVGVSPLELAQTHRLLLARRLLVETDLSVTRVAYASGFQSLRRFNAAFRAQYAMPPSALRRGKLPARRAGSVSLTLAYRPPLAWDALLACLQADATPGVEVFAGRRYGRTVRIGGHGGWVFAEDAPAGRHIAVEVSASLLPVLMPLIAGLRRLFDLDAEPAVVDAHLAQHGLAALVARRPGLRVPGVLDGFEIAVRAIAGPGLLGDPLETGVPGLTHLAPTAAQAAEAGLTSLGGLRLEAGADVEGTRRALMEVTGIDEPLATRIVMRALSWPDAFSSGDRALLARAEEWRPWRAYAALHLWMGG